VLNERTLARHEIEAVWTIDRTELIERGYFLENGELVLKPAYFDVRSWPPGEAEKYTPLLQASYDRGGWFYGIFDDARLVGTAVLDNRFLGRQRDQLQLEFFHVSHPYRHRGLGQRLFALARDEARRRGARKLYISATPSEHTINFYLRQGSRLSPEPDAELLALEPDDIHLECDVG
jgi:predicted N-acetyltransferase YhbS